LLEARPSSSIPTGHEQHRPTKIEAAITPRTVGIVPVHLYGHCADMKAVSTIAKKHKLWVVEDNAQSIDAHGDGFKQGELSDAVCTSFIIQKNLGTYGDGGALITNRPDIEQAARRLRNHGSLKRSVHSFGSTAASMISTPRS